MKVLFAAQHSENVCPENTFQTDKESDIIWKTSKCMNEMSSFTPFAFSTRAEYAGVREIGYISMSFDCKILTAVV